MPPDHSELVQGVAFSVHLTAVFGHSFVVEFVENNVGFLLEDGDVFDVQRVLVAAKAPEAYLSGGLLGQLIHFCKRVVRKR